MPVQAQRGVIRIGQRFANSALEECGVVSTTPRPPFPAEKDLVPIVQKGRGFEAGLDGVENLDPTGTVLPLTSHNTVCVILAVSI
jgi:hypothetical protein